MCSFLLFLGAFPPRNAGALVISSRILWLSGHSYVLKLSIMSIKILPKIKFFTP